MGGEWAFSNTDEDGADIIDVERLFSAVRRQIPILLIAVSIFVVLGASYVFTAPPEYTATSRILIDSSNTKLVDQLSAIGGGIDDEASVLSQVELLKAGEISLDVVDNLDLGSDTTFNAATGSPLSRLFGLVRRLSSIGSIFASEQFTASPEELRMQAASRLASDLDVARVGRTYVLEVSYTTANPELAARIANAFSEAYLNDQLDSKYEATRRASGWLQDRIAELRAKSIETDLAVQKFTSDNGLLSTGGELLSDQQLSQLTARLVAVQSETAQAQARLQSIQAIIESGNMDAVVSDALNMPVISTMRASYLDAARREADISARLGEGHQQAVRLRQEMSEYRRLMFEELSRIAQSYESAYQIAKSQQDNLEAQVQQATGVSTLANDSQVQLRELEREAESYRNLYQIFLQRYQEAVQQESFPVTEARIISRATPPKQPSAPKIPLTIALFAAMGAVVGAGLGTFREFRDRFFRTGEQVRSELGLEFLGFVPIIKDTSTGDGTESAGYPNVGTVRHVRSITSHVLDHPMSMFAETLRSTKIAVDVIGSKANPKIVGVISVLPGEGKSTIAINFAEHLAKQGLKTLLLDGDLRNSSCTRALTPHADRGLIEVLLEDASPAEMLFVDPRTNLTFLPTVATRRIPYSSELLTSPGMAAIFAASTDFDYVVIDLPPLDPVVDARAIAGQLDSFIMVVEWGHTPRRMVRSTLEGDRNIAEKCAGVILNRVDTGKLRLYQTDDASTYYAGRHDYYVDAE